MSLIREKHSSLHAVSYTSPHSVAARKKPATNIYPLMAGAALVTVLDTFLNTSLVSFATFSVVSLGIVAILGRRKLDRFFNCLTKLNRRYKFTTFAFQLMGTFFLLDALSTPTAAQFFQGAEEWMNSQFGGETGAGNAIPLVFNVLRGLFLLYLGIALVKVIQAARQDEDWQNLARTPMIILIAVTMGDILASLIIGGGGGGGAG